MFSYHSQSRTAKVCERTMNKCRRKLSEGNETNVYGLEVNPPDIGRKPSPRKTQTCTPSLTTAS